MKKYIFLLLVASTITLFVGGCVEARLRLSDKSRLPKWVVLPEGKKRNDFYVKMEWNSTLTGAKIIFKVYEKDRLFVFREDEVTIDKKNNILSLQLSSPPEGFPQGFPKYISITVNGITDIVEQRKMEPVFYMTDDPNVWKELGEDKGSNLYP